MLINSDNAKYITGQILGVDGGRLSPHWEEPTHQFGRRIVEKIIAV